MFSDELIAAQVAIDKARHERGISYMHHLEGCKFYLWRQSLDCNCAEIHDKRQAERGRDTCQQCGTHRFVGVAHTCKQVSMDEIRAVIREELESLGLRR